MKKRASPRRAKEAKAAPAEFEAVFANLRAILRKQVGALRVKADTPTSFSLEGETGPTTLRMWGGKMKVAAIPVAWVEIRKAYVSYHLMGVYCNAPLQEKMSKELKARRQGKTCFNFKTCDAALFAELEELTVQSIGGFRKAGFIRGGVSA